MRTDVHSPAHLITEDYEYRFSVDTRAEPSIDSPPSQWLIEMMRLQAEARRLVASSPLAERSTEQCHHCGAWIRYAAILRHTPTGDHIAVGETCLDNRFERATADFHKLRKAAQLDRERQRIVTARRQFVNDNPDLAWLNGSEAEDDVPESIRWSDFVWDLRDKFQRYGELSERQVAALRRTVEKSNRPKAPEPTWIEVPAEGRQTVTGTVLAVKFYENDYGTTVKMLLKVGTDDAAWKLWTTVPRSLHPERGEEVTIKVTVERSSDDPTFAKGKRPMVVA